MEKLYYTGPVTHFMKQLNSLQRFRDKNMYLFETLTDREIEVLSLIASGMKNAAIAQELNISRVTVQNHRSHIREKLDIHNHTEYMKYALAYDLIQLYERSLWLT